MLTKILKAARVALVGALVVTMAGCCVLPWGEHGHHGYGGRYGDRHGYDGRR